MSFEVIHDAEKDVAALIDAEFGRALGPIASGESAVELLERFAAAHGVDPATIPTGELESRWKDFVTTLTADVEDAAGEVHKVADEVLGGGHPSAGTLAPVSPIDPSEQVERVEPAVEPEPEPPAGVTPAEPEAPAAEAPQGPVTDPKPGHVVCPTCDGWREVVAPSGAGTITCPTCDGAGEVPAHEDAAAQHPAS